MAKRLLFGPILILLLLGGLALDAWLDYQPLPEWFATKDRTTWPPGSVILPVVLLLSVFASRELAAILQLKQIEASKRITTFAAVLGLLVSCLVPSWLNVTDAVAVVSSAAVLVLGAAMVFYSRDKSAEGVVAATGGALLSFVYLGLMFGFVLAIRREHTAWELLWVIAITKACDTGAYFTGKAFGRHKLIPWLSPGKTWEGLWGGIALSAGVSVLGMWLLETKVGLRMPPLWMGVIPGLVFAVVGQVGDLAESVLKRDAGTKDSGASLPGFGGMLDILDSPLLVSPVAFWWLRVMESKGFFTPISAFAAAVE
jgi:phosphatidate cytidylyltransferase